MRLRDLYTGGLTVRELIAYIREIPMESALGRSLLGEAADWTASTHLIADAVDLLNIANWQRSGTKKRAPKPMKRPKPKEVPGAG